jgi:two-component system response regulator HydG
LGLAAQKGANHVIATEPHPASEQTSESNLLNLLIVEDERAVRECCREVARSVGFGTHLAESRDQALRMLEAYTIDVVLLDLRLPNNNGFELLREIRRRRPEAVVIVMTGFATVTSAVQAMKLGAYDYITKPFNVEELKLDLERVTEHLQVAAENRLLREKLKSRQGFGQLVGHSPEMEKLYRIIGKAALSTHPVLILGESGTGKELVARAIHYAGPHKDKPFVPVDCGALVPTLIESELFGHVRGAFTGALRPKEGLLAMAEGGTIFLDEVGELPIDLQAKLLRAIQEHEIRPVGGTRSTPINVRILAATNRDLEVAVSQGTFRRDLYFRLNVLTLRIPPLRERKQDIPLLIGSFLDKINNGHTLNKRTVSDEALRLMMQYDWPGNVRELENCIQRACTTCSLPTIQTIDLPTQLQSCNAPPKIDAAPGQPDVITPLDQLEKQAILNAIHVLHGDKLEAAHRLGIGKTTLYRKLKEYGTAL